MPTGESDPPTPEPRRKSLRARGAELAAAVTQESAPASDLNMDPPSMVKAEPTPEPVVGEDVRAQLEEMERRILESVRDLVAQSSPGPSTSPAISVPPEVLELVRRLGEGERAVSRVIGLQEQSAARLASAADTMQRVSARAGLVWRAWVMAVAIAAAVVTSVVLLTLFSAGRPTWLLSPEQREQIEAGRAVLESQQQPPGQ